MVNTTRARRCVLEPDEYPAKHQKRSKGRHAAAGEPDDGWYDETYRPAHRKTNHPDGWDDWYHETPAMTTFTEEDQYALRRLLDGHWD